MTFWQQKLLTTGTNWQKDSSQFLVAFSHKWMSFSYTHPHPLNKLPASMGATGYNVSVCSVQEIRLDKIDE